MVKIIQKYSGIRDRANYVVVCCEDARGLRDFSIYSGGWTSEQCHAAIPEGFTFVWLTGYETLHEAMNQIRYNRNNY